MLVYEFSMNAIEGFQYKRLIPKAKELTDLKSDEWFQSLPSALTRLIEWTYFKWSPSNGKIQNDDDGERLFITLKS